MVTSKNTTLWLRSYEDHRHRSHAYAKVLSGPCQVDSSEYDKDVHSPLTITDSSVKGLTYKKKVGIVRKPATGMMVLVLSSNNLTQNKQKHMMTSLAYIAQLDRVPG